MLQTFRIAAGVAVLCLSALSPAAEAESLAGRWDAQLTLKGTVVPFRLDIIGEDPTLKGVLYNGDLTQTTTQASVADGALVLKFEHYLTTITAAPKDGTLQGKVEGRFVSEQYITALPFAAVRHQERPAAESFGVAPNIDGQWEIPHESAKGEKSWRFVVRQSGANVSAAILRVDGDTGSLTGTYRDGKFILSHFDGSRPLAMEITPTPDGALQIRLNGGYVDKNQLVAYRPEAARAKGFGEPADFQKHTSWRDQNEKFSFKFPDVTGKQVSSDDPKFRNKVIIAIITGTWCPNCHDEAQYLVQLYRKYRDQGLEIVALDFEEPEQQDELKRVKAFTEKYGVEYTYLIAGAPAEMWEKLPQAVNLNTWPATFFVDRTGKVRKIHTGFAAPASGQFHQQLKAEFTSTIEALLAENGRNPGSAHSSETAGLVR